MKHFVLVFIAALLLTVTSGCNKQKSIYPETPIVQELLDDQLNEILQANPKFEDLYHRLRTYFTFSTPAQKAAVKDITYRSFMEALDSYNDSVAWKHAADSIKGLSIPTFATDEKLFASKMNLFLKQNDIAQHFDHYVDIAGGYCQYNQKVADSNYASFTINPLQGPIEQVSFVWNYTDDPTARPVGEGMFTDIKKTKSVRLRSSYYNMRRVVDAMNNNLPDYRWYITITSLTIDGVNYKPGDNSFLPEALRQVDFTDQAALQKAVPEAIRQTVDPNYRSSSELLDEHKSEVISRTHPAEITFIHALGF